MWISATNTLAPLSASWELNFACLIVVLHLSTRRLPHQMAPHTAIVVRTSSAACAVTWTQTTSRRRTASVCTMRRCVARTAWPMTTCASSPPLESPRESNWRWPIREHVDKVRGTPWETPSKKRPLNYMVAQSRWSFMTGIMTLFFKERTINDDFCDFSKTFALLRDGLHQ